MTELAQPSDNTSLHPFELAAASAALTSRASVPDSIDPIDSIASHEGFQGATEANVAYWAASVRIAFGRNREQFNFAICDALATAGVTPTAASVLRVGKWGHHTSVASDVSAWLSQLTQRFVELQAGVPLPARKLANDLIEKLFSLSQLEAEKNANLRLTPLEEKLEVLAAAFESELEKLDIARVQIQAGETQRHQLQSELDAAIAAAAKAGLAVELERHQLQAVVTQLRNDLVTEREKAAASALRNAQAVSDLQRSALAAQQTAAEALHRVRDEADAERRRLMLQLDEQRTSARRTVDALRTEVLSLTNRVETVRQLSEDTNVNLVREKTLHEAARLAISKEREQWAQQRLELTSPEAKSQSILQLVMMHRSLGLQMYRNHDADGVNGTDLAARLCAALGVSQALASQIVQGIPVNDQDDVSKKVTTSSK